MSGKTYSTVEQTIFQSSIAKDCDVRFQFEDFLKLANWEGIVDMTHEAIARWTNVPLDRVQRCITELEKPDPFSKSPDFEGRRILLLDEHRNWGWWIPNFEHYQFLRGAEIQRFNNTEKVRKWRKKKAGEQERKLAAIRARRHREKKKSGPPGTELNLDMPNLKPAVTPESSCPVTPAPRSVTARHASVTPFYEGKPVTKCNPKTEDIDKGEDKEILKADMHICAGAAEREKPKPLALESEARLREEMIQRCGEQDWKEFGGIWTLRWRENLEKYNRVMADVDLMVREHTVHTSIGGLLNFYWNDFLPKTKW
jgi:hypothetical protein